MAVMVVDGGHRGHGGHSGGWSSCRGGCLQWLWKIREEGVPWSSKIDNTVGTTCYAGMRKALRAKHTLAPRLS